jgi:hypothetical protein
MSAGVPDHRTRPYLAVILGEVNSLPTDSFAIASRAAQLLSRISQTRALR